MTEIDQSLQEFAGYRLQRANSAVMSKMNGVFAQFGLRRTTFSALALVVDNPGLRQSQLAAALAIERPNFVQIVDELEGCGLVLRQRAVGDRRAYAIHATPAGCALFDRAVVAVRACDARLCARLSTAQLEALSAALKIIEKNADLTEVDDGS